MKLDLNVYELGELVESFDIDELEATTWICR